MQRHPACTQLAGSSSLSQALLISPGELSIYQESVESVPKPSYVSYVYIMILQFN